MKYLIKILLILFATILITSCQSNADKKTSKKSSTTSKGKEVLFRIKPGPNNPRNSEGDFIKLKDSRLLFVYTHFTGTNGGDYGSAHLSGRYSSDDGKTWSDDHIIVKNKGDINVMSVSLLRLQNGNIALFYLRKNSKNDCIPMMRISTDEAKTWSKPTPVIQDKEGYFTLNNDRVIQLESGRLLAPVSLHNTPGSQWSNRGRIWSYYSDDNGKSWEKSEEVPNLGSVMLQEPGVVKLNNRKIMMFIRTDQSVQYLSYSNDQGETWTPATPSKIPSPRSPASIARIPSTGDLLMVWNNNGLNQNRRPFNSAISKDEGKTWTDIRTIADKPHGRYCYTAIYFMDKSVLLAYSAGNSPQGRNHWGGFLITRLSLNWIYGREVNE